MLLDPHAVDSLEESTSNFSMGSVPVSTLDFLNESNNFLASKVKTKSEPLLPSAAATSNETYHRGRKLRVDILSTWGDKGYAGLTGIEIFYGSYNEIIPIEAKDIFAEPYDLSSIGCFDDPRVPSNLINGNNNTTDDSNMWLIPFNKGGKHCVEFTFLREYDVTGIR